MAGLTRYASEARARADEILALMDDLQIDALREWLRQNLDRELLVFIFTLTSRVSTILAQTPAKDRVWVQKTPQPAFVREWLAARHWAIASARALSIAAELEVIPGYGYREAVRRAAPVADEWLGLPEPEDLLSLRLFG